MELKLTATICPHCQKDSEAPVKPVNPKLKYRNEIWMNGHLVKSKLTGTPRPFGFFTERYGFFFCRTKEELEAGMKEWRRANPVEVKVKVIDRFIK